MNDKTRAAMQQALEALEYETSSHKSYNRKPLLSSLEAITALREALAEQAELCPLCGDGKLYEHTMYRCKGCGSELADARLMDKNKALAEQVEQEPDGLEKALRAILPPVFPFEQMFSTQGEVNMSNNNMREIGYAFINHAGEFQFVPGAAENIPVNSIMVYATEEGFKKACDSARELADKFSTINHSKSFRDGYELGKQAVINEDGK